MPCAERQSGNELPQSKLMATVELRKLATCMPILQMRPFEKRNATLGCGRSPRRLTESAENNYDYLLSPAAASLTTGLVSVPIPSIEIDTESPFSNVKSSGGTTPVPVSKKAPFG